MIFSFDLCRPRDYADIGCGGSDFFRVGGGVWSGGGCGGRHSRGVALRLSWSEPFGSVDQEESRWAPFHGRVAIRR